MTRAARNRRGAKGKSKAGRRRILLIAASLGGTVLAVGLGVYLWPWTAHPDASTVNVLLEPPAIDLAGTDPAVAKVVSGARTAVSQSPRSAAAWGRLGMVFYAHEFPVEAGVCFAQAEQLDTREARWPYFQGIILAESDPDTAIRKLQRAADLCGDLPNAPRLRVGELLLGQGRLEEAQEQFQRVLQRDPANARAHLGLGRLAFQRGHLQEAQNQSVLSLKERGTQKAARILLAQTRERLGKKRTAQEYRLTAAMPDDPAWPDPFLDEAFKLQTGKKRLLVRAGVLLEQGHVKECIEQCQQLARDDPDSETAWLTLGKALIQEATTLPDATASKRELLAAQEALQKVLRLAPDSVEAHFNLGFASYLQRDYRAAVTWYRRATELKPDFTFAYHDLGHCLLLLGDRAGAIEAFRACLRCQPDLAEAHKMLGELLLKEGQSAAAFEHLRLAVQLKPADAKAKQLLIQMLKQMAVPMGP